MTSEPGSIQTVFVAGAGLMGHGIAQVLASSGRRVVLYEPELARAIAGRDRIAGNLDRAIKWYTEKLGFKVVMRQKIDADREIAWLRTTSG